MEYTVQKLAELAGVSPRTLRYYDQIDLLKPARCTPAGYRIYGEAEVDTLQQILFFRALGLELDTIAAALQDPAFDRLAALRGHLHALQAQQSQLSRLIDTVQRTIQKEEGMITMKDSEKFEGFKQQLVDENERKYGAEIRAKYGEDTVDASNARMMGLTQAQYDAMQQTAQTLQDLLEKAVQQAASPQAEAGREIAALHKQWLHHTWPQYTVQAHLGLVQMYLDDPRFTAHYDGNVPGCAQFLRDAVYAWAERV